MSQETTLPARLSQVPPAKLAKTVSEVQTWVSDAFGRIATLVKSVQAAQTQADAVLAKLADTITTPEQYEEYVQVLRVAKKRSKEFDGQRTDIVGPVNQAVKRVNDLAKEGESGWERVSVRVERLLQAYRMEQQRKADAEARRIREEQIKQQEKERLTAEKKAVKLEAKGQVEAAQAVRENAELAAAAPAPTITVAPATPKVEGAHTRRYWHATVTDLAKVPEQYIIRTVNLKALEEHAKATEGKVPVPGVSFSYEDKDIVRT